MKRLMLGALIAVATTVSSTAVRGQDEQGCQNCSPGDQPMHCCVCGDCCKPQTAVVKTVMVPTMVAETRIKYVMETKTEERELPYTVFKRVPVTRKYTQDRCYLADETRTKVITWKQCRQVKNPVVRTHTVQVPETEIRTGTRTVCRCIDGQQVRCEEPYTCEVTVMRPETRSSNCVQPDVVFETKSDVISYCVKTPKKHTVTCAEETIYKLVPVEKTRKVTVCVPVKVPKPVEVTVCRMVPKTVICCPKCKLHGLLH